MTNALAFLVKEGFPGEALDRILYFHAAQADLLLHDIVSQWSEVTILRVAQEILSTLRDFGVLEGASKKRLAPVYLPVEAFAYLAFYLQQRQPSGERLLHDPEWGLFFLSHHMVERFFMEAHQLHLLEYYAAGSIMRITFPTASLEEYAHALAQRAD